MAWVAPRTWVVGELVTAAFMNQDVRDNQTYLKTETDRMDDVTFDEPGNALDVIYQNLSGKIRIITVTVGLQVDDDGAGEVSGSSQVIMYSDAGTPPTVANASVWLDPRLFANAATDELILTLPLTIVVLPNHYYRAVSSNVGSGIAPLLAEWIEWDLH